MPKTTAGSAPARLAGCEPPIPEAADKLNSSCCLPSARTDTPCSTPKADGPALFYAEGGKQWLLPELDRFLRAHKLPSWDEASFASLLKSLAPADRQSVESYLTAQPSEKALALGLHGGAYWHQRSATLEEARRDTLTYCRKQTGANCHLAAYSCQRRPKIPCLPEASSMTAGSSCPEPLHPTQRLVRHTTLKRTRHLSLKATLHGPASSSAGWQQTLRFPARYRLTLAPAQSHPACARADKCWGGRPRGILCQGLVVNIRT